MTKVSEFVKDDLINSLAGVRACLLATAATISEDQRFTPFLGDWSGLELFAHIAGWDATNLQAVRDIQGGTMPKFYSQYDTGWQTYKDTLVEGYRKKEFNEKLQVVKKNPKEMLENLEEI